MLSPDELPLHVGDRVRIVCPEAPELCVDRAVGPDGTLDLPRIGAIPAAVRLPREIAWKVQSLLPMTGTPLVVKVDYLGSARSEIEIAGAVEHPLVIYAPQGLSRDRLLQAVSPTRDADLALLNLPNRIAPGTRIEVESVSVARKISVLGGVAVPQTLPPSNGLSLSSVLEAVGGLTAHADPAAIVVLRGGEPIPVNLPTDGGFLIRPGDVVRVGLIAARHFVIVRGLAVRPGSVEYAPGMTVLRALSAAGGIRQEAGSGTLIWQTGPKSFRLSIAFLLARRIPDPVLAPEDTLIVESAKP